MSEGEGAPKVDEERLAAVSAVASAAERWVDSPSMRAMVEAVETARRNEIRLALKASYMFGWADGAGALNAELRAALGKTPE